MSYTPTNWKKGDVITSTKLNKLEQGVANGILVVGVDTETGTMDKTWQEIHDADFAIIKGSPEEGLTVIDYVNVISVDSGDYIVQVQGSTFVTDSADGYPTAGDEPAPSPFPNDGNGGGNAS